MLERLRRFNNSLDDHLLELAMPLLLLGFIMATTDWLLHGRMATQLGFEAPWAIAQAIAIDGAFFGIWLRIFKWKGLWYKAIPLVVAGLIMALVATLVNGILTYQQVYNIADSFIAMQALHIDLATLVYIRAPLVVFVAILIIPIRAKPAEKDGHMAIPAIAKRPRQKATVLVKELPKELPVKADSHIDIATEPETDYSMKAIVIAEWLQVQGQHGAKKAIADRHGIGYSTVKKYIAESEKSHA